jgi:NADPH:quinone reductase-like Zn-dependent oxidoreductase
MSSTVTSPAGEHLAAAILPSKGSRLEIRHRPTPKPGAEELLIKVKSIALNPIDHYQRDFGFVIEKYPQFQGPILLVCGLIGGLRCS